MFVIALYLLSLFLLPLVSAHARLAYPIPLGTPPTTPDGNFYDAPLRSDGVDFPCKYLHKTSVLTPTATWNAGGGTHFEILGGNGTSLINVHSGGSCQASLSFDDGNTWKVLHSWHGGCPRGAVKGSLSSDKNQRFDFKVPVETRPGDALFAWTWVPATGNRNDYFMSCASVTITGTGSSTLDSFPDMYLGQMVVGGHIARGQCFSEEFTEAVFPYPGANVDTQNLVPSGLALKAPSGGNCISPYTKKPMTPSAANMISEL